ncbi:Ral GTPase-activating protein subunit beta [Trichostrongylus colubriformis]|uniref:Ral GTPase-activating protein subunit beta n=1 Tax=Trichostrongylus colubriformis TaxID=6319 RepID=A0AAN8FDD3_TRICO
MDQVITFLKDVLEPIGNEDKTGGGEQAVLVPESPAMYEDWPTLEFPDLTKSILDLFSKPTSELVSSALLSGLTQSISEEDDQLAIRLQTDDQLRWCMQVLNYALTLSFTTHREFETVRGAVRIYLHWLRALTDFPEGDIPTPLSIIDALRNLFCRRIDIKGEVPRGLAIERQAREVETVLDAVRELTHTASRKYQNEVWARILSFLLNSADLLLADPLFPEEMGMRVGSRVVDTLFDLWFHAVLNEEIPSPTYWRTLAALCRRWRHHVTVIESWARKLLAMTVLVCRKMYGEDYCKIVIRDPMESITPFAFLPPVEEDGEVDLLYHSWFNLLCLLDSPADILSHDLMENKPINGGVSTYDGTAEVQPPLSLPLCFFLATTALQRMVDVFYGDSFVPIDFKESDVLVQKWTMATPTPSVASEGASKHPRSDFSRGKASTVTDSTEASRDTRDTDGTLTHESRGSFSSSTSAKEGRSLSDMTKRSVRTKQSERVNDDHSGTNMSASQHSQQSHSQHVSTAGGSRHTNDQISPKIAESVSQGRITDTKQSLASAESALRPLALQFVAHTLAVNPAYIPWVDEKGPKAERILDLTMEWLLAATQAKTEHKAKAEVTDDVISSLSLHSVDLDDVPEAMITGGGNNKRRSIASSTSSTAGDSLKGGEAGNSVFSGVATAGISDGIDGVSAGRAAAIAALTRIVCSKRTNEKLPNQQLARFLSTVHEALIEKDRLVLCSLFFYGQNLFRLGLPGVEAILPHYLFALDIILIESAKIRLHPSISEVDMRRACLRGLSSVVCWPTTFGMSKIPQLPESANLKSSAATYLQLRPRVYKTLVFSLRNETDPTNLHLTLAMCTVLMEESCSFDLGLTDEQTREMIKMAAQQYGNQTPEKGLCVSFIRGLVSAICDRICRNEWTSEHSVSLAAIDVLNCLSHLHPAVLFNNKDVSTGSLIVASLCRFIETQLGKPPPLHSKDLHSTVVAAYGSIAVWVNAAPILAECESVLNTIAEAVQLGVTGSKKKDNFPDESKAASKRVLEAAEYLMYSLFSVVGRNGQTICDERRLLYTYGPAAIDTTKFLHVIVNGDTLLSLHEASHIKELADGCPCVLYVRRSPMQPASAGVAKLRPHPDGYSPDQLPPPTPLGSTVDSIKLNSAASSLVTRAPDTLSVASGSTAVSNVSGGSTISKGSHASNASVATGSILSGVCAASVESSQTTLAVPPSSIPADVQSTRSAPAITASVSHVKISPQVSPTVNTSIGDRFEVPPEFLKVSCKLTVRAKRHTGCIAFKCSGNAPPSRRSAELRVMLVWLERAEDMLHFPIEELLSSCDDGGERPSNAANERPAYLAIFVHLVEPGLVNIRTKGSSNRFGEAGPLCDSMVVSLASLPSLVRLTILNIVRRNVAEIDNYQFTHTKRKQAIIDFGKKYAANLTYEDFLLRLMMWV